MPYKRKDKWMAQARKEGQRKGKVFLTKKEALRWEAEMKRKPVEEWSEKTDMDCLADWTDSYLDFVRVKFSDGTYDEKKSMFRRFFDGIDPTLPASKLTPGTVLAYIMKQKEKRSGNAANKDRKNLVAGWN